MTEGRRAASSATVTPAAAIAVGALAGLMSGLFGIGGGVIVVPGLMAVGMERRLAHGTSLASTLPIAVASTATFARAGETDWAMVVPLAAGAIVGAVVGAQLLQVIDKRILVIVYATTILAAAARLLLTSDTSGRGDLDILVIAALVAIGFTAGLLAGLLGIGGGVVMVPSMIVLLSIEPVVAKATSVAVIVPTAIAGTLRNRKHANADLRTALTVGSAGVLTAVAGSTISTTLSDTAANISLAGLLVVLAVIQLRTLRAPRPDPTA